MQALGTHLAAFVAGVVVTLGAFVGFLVLTPSAERPGWAAEPPPTATVSPTGALFSGSGLRGGATLWAYIGGELCRAARADQYGLWSMTIEADAPCRPRPGAEVTFVAEDTLFSSTPYASTPRAVWTPGGRPPDPIKGYTLTKR